MGPDDFDGIRPLIDRIVASVCKQNRLSCSDCDDFRQHTYLEVIKNDYFILRTFEGRSSPSTYLTIVIRRLYYQHCYKATGKWRPSAEAKRLGRKAIVLEQMLTRDGYSLKEATDALTTGNDPEYTKAEIEQIYLRLPERPRRPTFIAEEQLPEAPAPDETDGPLMQEQREQMARRLLKVLDDAIRTLTAQDQLILQMRFQRAMKVPEIASVLHIEAKKLYKRIDGLIDELAEAMERAGVSRDDALDVLRHDGPNLALDPENAPSSPSQENDGTHGEGSGRRGNDDDDDH